MEKRTEKKLARAIHNKTCARLDELRRNKIDVYLALRTFKRSRLYRHIDVEMCAERRRRVCTPRTFPTWRDYLSSLGRCGISFGYFAELERLENRFGEGFVQLCAHGIPVEVRRTLLRAPERVAEKVREVLRDTATDTAALIERIHQIADAWESEDTMSPPSWQTPAQRVSRYRRHVRQWQAKLSRLVDEMERVPRAFRHDAAFGNAARAWTETFEAHIEIGERLARLCLTPTLGLPQCEMLKAIRERWTSRNACPAGAAA